VIKAGDTYYMYYTSANPWQNTGAGGKGEPRIDYATSPDGLKWTYQGVSIPNGKPGQWDEERPQAPAKPILKNGVYYMYYAGKNPNDEHWFYFQATRDFGKRFQIGLAKQPVPVNNSTDK